jgi:hypothetical protein
VRVKARRTVINRVGVKEPQLPYPPQDIGRQKGRYPPTQTHRRGMYHQAAFCYSKAYSAEGGRGERTRKNNYKMSVHRPSDSTTKYAQPR